MMEISLRHARLMLQKLRPGTGSSVALSRPGDARQTKHQTAEAVATCLRDQTVAAIKCAPARRLARPTSEWICKFHRQASVHAYPGSCRPRPYTAVLAESADGGLQINPFESRILARRGGVANLTSGVLLRRACPPKSDVQAASEAFAPSRPPFHTSGAFCLAAK